MATYAIGDIQGCYEEFAALLELMDFRSDRDRLWLLGDLINRGPDNLSVVRRVMALGGAAVTILGNHDLHFLAVHRGGHSPNRSDTFTDLLAAPDVDEISDWYRHQLLFHRDKTLGYAMAHAGVPFFWSLKEARTLAAEVEAEIRGPNCEHYFQAMYGNEPDRWRDDWTGMDRLRVITNYLTRMRLVDEQGVLDFSHKGVLEDAPSGLVPWFELTHRQPPKQKLLFGHWAALEGFFEDEHVIGLDTGCVWGRSLTGLRLDDAALFTVNARAQST